MRLRWIAFVCVGALGLVACDRPRPKKPDPTLGRVTGLVLCADTGKPARFAEVILTKVPVENEDPSDIVSPLIDSEKAVTGLEGRFTMEAVKPGRYFAFATLDGYLDPFRGLDVSRLEKLESDKERALDALKQWKANLVDVSVAAHRTTVVTIDIEPAAEIEGTVTFDDGSPAIGVHFELLRKTADHNWSSVGLGRVEGWSLPEVSDRHGHYRLENLVGGEYIVCALMPPDWEDDAPRVCTGNVFRQRDARIIRVESAGVAQGVDIVIPLTGMHRVSGTVRALIDDHPMHDGVVQLLYADDGEKTRETVLDADGYYQFRYVPSGEYVVRVTHVSEIDPNSPEDPQTREKSRILYADKETPLSVATDMQSVDFALTEAKPSTVEEKH